MSTGLRYWGRRAGLWVLLALGARTRAEAWLEATLLEFPNDAHVLISRAHQLALAGPRGPAIEAYRHLLRLHPAHGPGWFNLGYLLEQDEDWDGARTAFETALVQDPKLDRAWYGLGLVLIRLGRLDEAVPALERNTELQPMSPYAWYQLARVHLDRQEPEEAIKVIRHLKGFEPKVAAQLERESGLVVSSG